MSATRGVQLTLRFSQSSQPGEPTPSGQLSNPFNKLCLSSQPQQLGSQATQGERPPVPLFSHSSAEDMSCSQQEPYSQEVLGTQDFITPVDQFQLEYEPAAVQREPARLSPNRVKRPRKDEDTPPEDDPAGGGSQLRGGGGAAAMPCARGGGHGHAVPRRAKSPPCYRSMFREEDEDECFAPWGVPRPARHVPESRFKCDFKEIGLLGQGNFSRVLRARHRLNGREFAVKRSIRELTPDNPAFAQFIQEAQVLAHLPPHPHIVGYYASWTERGMDGGEQLYHQLEKCDISLGALAALGEPIKEPELLEVLRQMCLALSHLHAHGVAHLDIKPDNIYTVEPSEDEGGPAAMSMGGGGSQGSGGSQGVGGRRVYKLGDFGQATRLNAGAGKVAVNEGDCRYLPLELLNSDMRRLDKADMFSLGATLLELASRSELPSGGQLYQDLRHGKVPLLPTISTSLFKLICALLSPRPEDRPSADKVLASPLLTRRGAGGNGGKGTSPRSAEQQQQQAAVAAAALQPQGSSASTISAHTAEVGGGGGGGGRGKYGGLVLQRTVHC